MRSRGNTAELPDRDKGLQWKQGRKHNWITNPLFFRATSGRNRHSSTVRGILASISEAAIRVAIQAHLPEDGGRQGGREGSREREEREQIYERRKRRGVLHARRV